MKARMTMVAAVAIAAAALAAGCGSDEESGDAAQGGGADGTTAAQTDGGGQPGGGDGAGDPVTTSDLSKAEFVEEASAVCNEERKDAFEKMSSRLEREAKRGVPRKQAFANMFRATFVPIVEAEVERVRELGAPEGDEEAVEAFLVAQEEALDRIRALKKASDLGAFEPYFRRADRLLRRYGLDACRKG